MAQHCTAAAEHTSSSELRQQLLELAKRWTMRADGIGGGLHSAPPRSQ
jgi:hypothetical protein